MIKILAAGRKHPKWLAETITEYEKRLRKPFDLQWQFVEDARLEQTVLREPRETPIILLDERGQLWDSPTLSRKLASTLTTHHHLTLIIGGAFGITPAIRARATLVWSLSPLVFPHQICRLLAAEQIYRAQEIHLGHPYHHA